MGSPPNETQARRSGPPSYREAMEITERGLRSEVAKTCAGVHLLRPPPREPKDLRERVLFWERVVAWLPKMFKLRDALAQLVRRGRLSRAEAKDQLEGHLQKVFPPNYVLWMEEGEMANARCALAKARWEFQASMTPAKIPFVPGKGLKANVIEPPGMRGFGGGPFHDALDPRVGYIPNELGQTASTAHSFHNCTVPQKGTIEAAFANALRSVNHASTILGTIYGKPEKMTPTTRYLLNRHFHTTDRDDVLRIFRTLFRISKALEQGLKFECETDCGPKNRCGYAWATQWFGGFGKIHICFNTRPELCSFSKLTPQDQAAVIIHEAAHRHVGIADKAYVWEIPPLSKRDYSKLTAKQAMDNADSYAYFSVMLMPGW